MYPTVFHVPLLHAYIYDICSGVKQAEGWPRLWKTSNTGNQTSSLHPASCTCTVHIGGMNEFYSCVYYFYNERLTYLNEIIPYKNLRTFK